MIKGYVVSENVGYETSVLVFAETANQAKSIANTREEMDSFDYIDLRANRAKFADGHENDDESDLRMLLIRNGWWFEIDSHIIDSENVDEMIAQGII